MLDINIPYTPRPFQVTIHDSLARFNVLLIHRRAGKSVLAINHLIFHALYLTQARPDLKRLRFAYMAPLKSQAKRVIWDYLLEYTSTFPDRIVRQTELSVDIPSLNNARFYLLGADEPDSLRGIYLDGVVMDEFDQMKYRTFTEIIRPALADRMGICLFAGTPKGRGNLYNLYEKTVPENPASWARHKYTVDDTNIIPEDELAQIKKETPEDEFQQEYFLSYDAATRGAYYSSIINRHTHQHKTFSYDPSLPVYSVWDLGMADSTAIAIFQILATGAKIPEIRILDFYENSSEPLQHYVGHLFSLGLPFVRHYLPHDVRVRSLSTGMTRLQTLRGMGMKNINIVPKHTVQEGINAVRNILPSVFFNTTDDDPSPAQKRVAGLLEHLRQYKARTTIKNPDVLQASPQHDEHSHGADCIRYLATCNALSSSDGGNTNTSQSHAVGSRYDPLSSQYTDPERYDPNEHDSDVSDRHDPFSVGIGI